MFCGEQASSKVWTLEAVACSRQAGNSSDAACFVAVSVSRQLQHQSLDAGPMHKIDKACSTGIPLCAASQRHSTGAARAQGRASSHSLRMPHSSSCTPSGRRPARPWHCQLPPCTGDASPVTTRIAGSLPPVAAAWKFEHVAEQGTRRVAERASREPRAGVPSICKPRCKVPESWMHGHLLHKHAVMCAIRFAEG